MKRILFIIVSVIVFISCKKTEPIDVNSLENTTFNCYVKGVVPNEYDLDYYLLFRRNNTVIDSISDIWLKENTSGIERIPSKGTYKFDGSLITMTLWTGGGFSGVDSVTKYAIYKNDTIYYSDRIYTKK